MNVSTNGAIEIVDIGEVPYSILRPVLIRIKNPDHLRELEKKCPQLLGADAEIWQEFIKRDIPNWETKPHQPRNPAKWYQVYRKLKEDLQAEVDRDEEVLRQQLAGIKSEADKHKSLLVDKIMLPGKAKRVPASSSSASRWGSTGDPGVLRFTGGSRTKNIVERARREARELSRFGGSGKKRVLATPTHELGGKATRIIHAPQGLIEQHRRPVAPASNDPSKEAPKIFAPRKANGAPTTTTPATTASSGFEFSDREKRLRALTGQRSKAAGAEGEAPKPAFGIQRSNNESDQPPPPRESKAYVVPRMPTRTPTPNNGNLSPAPKMMVKKRPANDPFMPAKKRKLT